MSDLAAESLRRLDNWLVAHEYRGYEPFDGLNAWLRPLARGKLGRQLLQQAVKRFPFNCRPWLGIQPATSTKAMGYFARAYLKLYQAWGEEAYLRRAQDCLAWLLAHPSPGYSGLCWGNHFDYQSRVFYLPKAAPTVVWTAHIAHAFLDALAVTGQSEYLEAARSIGRFLLADLERRTEAIGACISYIPGGYYPVHNANMLGAAALARLFKATGQAEYRAVAAEAVAYTLACQRPDGSWWYGEASNLRWVDNWHTAYVLDSLWWYMHSTGDQTYQAAFRRGAELWHGRFFLGNGTPKYYLDRTYPIDIQSAAQAIETLCLLSQVHDPACLETAHRVASWTVRHMQADDGHFYYERTPWYVNTTPMLHWGQATMLHALATLILEGKK